MALGQVYRHIYDIHRGPRGCIQAKYVTFDIAHVGIKLSPHFELAIHGICFEAYSVSVFRFAMDNNLSPAGWE